MLQAKAHAEQLQKDGKWIESIKYREEMATKWSQIVKEQVNTAGMSLTEVKNY